MTTANEKLVIVATDFAKTSGRDFFAGVLRFARSVSNWNLALFQSPADLTDSRLVRETRRGAVGIISTIAEGKAAQSALSRSPLPLVLVGTRVLTLADRSAPTSQVLLNEESVGRNGAVGLLSLGNFASFGFVHCPEALDQRLSAMRAHGFQSEIRSRGFPCSVFSRTKDKQELSRWLESLPKPTAILAGHDRTGVLVLNACRNAKLEVPAVVSVLGIDNDEPVCETAAPRLSSVRLDAEGEGFAAAEELARLLKRKALSGVRKVTFTTGAEIVDRGSVHPVAPASALIKKAMCFIVGHRAQAISVDDVVRHLRVSRRLASLRFQQFAGESIHDAILRNRLEEAAARLLTSTSSVARTIAPLGFGNVSYFSQVFRKKYGVSPAEYRRRKPSRHIACASAHERRW